MAVGLSFAECHRLTLATRWSPAPGPASPPRNACGLGRAPGSAKEWVLAMLAAW